MTRDSGEAYRRAALDDSPAHDRYVAREGSGDQSLDRRDTVGTKDIIRTVIEPRGLNLMAKKDLDADAKAHPYTKGMSSLWALVPTI